MLTRSFRFLDPANISPDLALRLRRLADDCERLELHRFVLPSTLKNAPLLENWMPSLTPEGLHLVGVASGHPVHEDRIVMTTPLWWADPDGTWVRSLSRFYRLGSQATRDGLRGVRLVTH